MHTFTWDSKNQEEILDCDHLYQEDDDRPPAQDDPDDLPPFLRKHREMESNQPLDHLDDELHSA
jgi:hypothetical protein